MPKGEVLPELDEEWSGCKCRDENFLETWLYYRHITRHILGI